MKTQPNVIVEFSNERAPITPSFNKGVIYTMNKFDCLTGETSIIKLDSETLACHEIYQSKFNLVHMAMFEKKSGNGDGNPTHKGRPNRISKSDLYRSSGRSSSKKRQSDSSYADFAESCMEKKILFSLVSYSKNHLNLEIISETWRGVPS